MRRELGVRTRPARRDAGLGESFDALVLLGHGNGLPEVLSEEELALRGPDLASLEPELIRLARLRFAPGNEGRQRKPRGGTFFTSDVPPAVKREFAVQGVPLLNTCGLFSMVPGAAHAEREAIRVPTFFGFGNQDLTDQYLPTMATYSSLTDTALYVLAGSGHCHNQAAARHLLWDRVLDWLEMVAPGAA